MAGTSHEADKEYCLETLGEVSRTFEIPINMVSEPMKTEICVGYEMCRIPDTIEDYSGVSGSEKNHLLEAYEEVLISEEDSEIDFFLEEIEKVDTPKANEAGYSDWELVENTDRVFNVFDGFDRPVKNKLTDSVGNMVGGMKKFTERYDGSIRIDTMDEFSDYCYYVAGTVGELLTGVFAQREDLESGTVEKLEANQIGFGEALQTVNIAKDVREDYLEEDAIFLPKKLLNKASIGHSDLAAMFENNSVHLDSDIFISAESSVEELIDHGTRLLDDAENYIKDMPTKAKDARTFTVIPYLMAVATSREAQNNPSRALRDEDLKISREEVYGILNNVDGCVETNERLEEVSNHLKDNELTPKTEI